MNKYLMLSAAAVMASTANVVAPASAGSTKIGFSGYCDGYELATGTFFPARHLYTACGFSGPGPWVVGISVKNRKFESIVGSRKFAFASDAGSNYIGLAFELPLATGNRWAYVCGSQTLCNGGTYYLGYAPKKGALRHLQASDGTSGSRSK